MTTRQHLIEQDCMDKLGWDITRIANSTDMEMIRSLSQFDATIATVPPPPTRVSTASPSPVPVAFAKNRQSLQSTPATPTMATVSVNTITKTTSVPDVHMVSRLREAIRLKRLCIKSDDILPEDILRLKTSIERDLLCLQKEMDLVQDEIDAHTVDEAKKFKIQSVLRKVLQSIGGPDDVLHMQEVEKQLCWLKDRIQTLMIVMNSDMEDNTS